MKMVSVLGFSNSIPRSAVVYEELNIERQLMALNAQALAAVASYGPDFGLAGDYQVCVPQYGRKDPTLFCAHDIAASELAATDDAWNNKYANDETMGPGASGTTPMSILSKWIASIKLNFDTDDLQPYYYQSGRRLGLRGGEIQLRVMSGLCSEQKQRDAEIPKRVTQRYRGPMLKLKHMTFVADGTRTLNMKETQLGCESKASWDVSVCYGCSCKQGLAVTAIKHTLVSDCLAETSDCSSSRIKDEISRCKTWFTKVDGVIRGYLNIVRTQLVAAKTLCCSLQEGDPRECSKFRFPKDCDGAGGVGRELGADRGGGGGGCLPKQKLRFNPKCGIGGIKGWEDMTSKHINRHPELFAASCKYALAVEGELWPTLARNFLPVPGLRPLGVDQSLEKKITKEVKYNTIMNKGFACVLNTGNTIYSNALNFAFSPFAGRRYVPPTIKRIQPHVLEISTGFNEKMNLGYVTSWQHGPGQYSAPSTKCGHNGHINREFEKRCKKDKHNKLICKKNVPWCTKINHNINDCREKVLYASTKFGHDRYATTEKPMLLSTRDINNPYDRPESYTADWTSGHADPTVLGGKYLKLPRCYIDHYKKAVEEGRNEVGFFHALTGIDYKKNQEPCRSCVVSLTSASVSLNAKDATAVVGKALEGEEHNANWASTMTRNGNVACRLRYFASKHNMTLSRPTNPIQR